MKQFYYIVFLSFLSMTSVAKVYKWVDEHGKTHYTQTPPPVNQKITSAQKIDKTGAVLIMKPVKRGHDYYCGNLLLLYAQGNEDILYENIKVSISGWEEERDVQQQQIASMKEPGKKWDIKKLKSEENKLANYNCRVLWGHEKIKEFESFHYRAKKTNESLKKQYKELKRKQDKECPADSKRFGSILVGDAARNWYKCHNGYEKQMKSIRNKISENKKSVRETRK